MACSARHRLWVVSRSTVVACGHSHLLGTRLLSVDSGSVAKRHRKANSFSYVWQPSGGSPIAVLESSGAPLKNDAFYITHYTPQLSNWPFYDTATGVFTLLGDASMVSLLDCSKDEPHALSIVNLYCTTKREEHSNAIPNMQNMSSCRAEWKKLAIEANLPTARCKAAYSWLLENNPTYAPYIERHIKVLASVYKNRFY